MSAPSVRQPEDGPNSASVTQIDAATTANADCADHVKPGTEPLEYPPEITPDIRVHLTTPCALKTKTPAEAGARWLREPAKDQSSSSASTAFFSSSLLTGFSLTLASSTI